MLDLLITLIAVAPVIMALLAAVAPPKAAWIRPALLPAVLLQLALTAALSVRHYLFGTLFGGVPSRALTSEEVHAFTNATTGLGLPATAALLASVTAAASAVAFLRHKGWRHALPWALISAACAAVDRAHASVVRMVADQPMDGGVDLEALATAVHESSYPWLFPSAALFAIACTTYAWANWWSRARWSEIVLPGFLLLGTGVAAALTASAFEAGLKRSAWYASTGFLDAGTAAEDAILFHTASGLLEIAVALSFALFAMRLIVARKQHVGVARAWLRGCAWLAVGAALIGASVSSEIPAYPVLLSRTSFGNVEPAAVPFECADWSMAYWLPLTVYAAVIGLVMITAAGPLRSDRRSVRPSTEA